MLSDFKTFIMRGNFVDLAIAVVIGSVFAAVVKTILENLINPILAVFGNPTADDSIGFELVRSDDATFISIGNIVTALVTFLLTAAIVYFIVVLPMNRTTDRFAPKEDDVVETAPEVALLTEIRDLLREQREGPRSTRAGHGEDS